MKGQIAWDTMESPGRPSYGGNSCDSRDGLLEKPPYQKRNAWRSIPLSTIVLGVICLGLSAWLLFLNITMSQDCRAQGFWRENEFDAAKKEIPPVYHQERFEPALRWNTSHKLYRPPLDPDYAGYPTPEIDDAWEDLVGAVNVFITPNEARNWQLGEGLWLDPKTGLYTAIVAVMHNLHCLDMLRKYIYKEEYPDLMRDYTFKPHVEHCLDALRLSIKCQGDMTLIPIKWNTNRNWIMPVFDEAQYTCRDYDALKDWANNRDSGDPKVFPQNAERLKAKGNWE